MLRRVATVAISLCVLSACSHQFAFRQDRRVQIVSPHNNATVTQPVTLRWAAHDTTGEGFAVFVDRSPIPPGAGLRSIGQSDSECRQTPNCPDAAYLAQHHVYVTTTPSLSLPRLVDKRIHSGDKDEHVATVVLVDTSAQRVGEAAFTVNFVVEHPK